MLAAILGTARESWVHPSWCETLFPQDPPTSAFLSEAIDDLDLRAHLLSALDGANGPIPDSEHDRSNMDPVAAFALEMISADAEATFSLLGHVALSARIREYVVGRREVPTFDRRQSRVALDLTEQTTLTHGGETGAEADPGALGHRLFAAWLARLPEADKPFLHLALDPMDTVRNPLEDSANGIIQKDASFAGKALKALRESYE